MIKQDKKTHPQLDRVCRELTALHKSDVADMKKRERKSADQRVSEAHETIGKLHGELQETRDAHADHKDSAAEDRAKLVGKISD
jgi:hypothetical protein